MTRIGAAELDQILAELRTRSDLDEQSLARVYRRLAKQVHPDLLHDDGSTFLYLQDQFERFARDWRLRQSRPKPPADFDPYRIVRELGYEQEISERAAVWIHLYRYRALGLTSRRVRIRPAMKRRGNEIHRSLVYWAGRYDRSLVIKLDRFLHGWNFSLAEPRARLFFMARRLVLQGFDSLMRYQERARTASREIAVDRFCYAEILISAYPDDPAFGALRDMIEWFLAESLRPPLRLDG